jgi:hypothetical protein
MNRRRVTRVFLPRPSSLWLGFYQDAIVVDPGSSTGSQSGVASGVDADGCRFWGVVCCDQQIAGNGRRVDAISSSSARDGAHDGELRDRCQVVRTRTPLLSAIPVEIDPRLSRVTLTPSAASGEGTETSLALHFRQVSPVRIQLFDQTEFPPPAQTLQPLLPAYGRQRIRDHFKVDQPTGSVSR